MTYRFGRVSRGRYSATLRGVTAYQPVTMKAMRPEEQFPPPLPTPGGGEFPPPLPYPPKRTPKRTRRRRRRRR